MKAEITKLDPKDILLLIREWNEETQEEFAKSVHRSYSSITKMETGDRNIYLHTFLEWCKLKDIKVTMEKTKR